MIEEKVRLSAYRERKKNVKSDNQEQPPAVPPRIEDKAPKPAGVIPRHMQSMVLIGVSVLMVLVMWLSGGKKHLTPVAAPLLTTPPLNSTDSARVQDFKQTIQTEQLAVRRPIPAPESGPGATLPGSYTTSFPPTQLSMVNQPGSAQPDAALAPPAPLAYQGASQQPLAAPAVDPVKAEQKKREYLSLFASNIALTYRKGEEARRLAGSEASSSSAPRNLEEASAPQDHNAELARELQTIAALQAVASHAQTSPQRPPIQNSEAPRQSEEQATPKRADTKTVADSNSSVSKKHVLFERTEIDTVLINRLDGSFAGPVECLVTNDIYSHDLQRVLIPAGTKVLGEADRVNAFGQERLAVFFHRLIMPDGYSVKLDRFQGLDQIGATALRDQVDSHYAQIFGASLAIGLLGGVAQVGTGNIYTDSAADRMRNGFGVSMATSAERILDRFLNILPTITIREGHRVKVHLSNDLMLPDYASHTLREDL
jgi:type IV secretion system protein VirB10